MLTQCPSCQTTFRVTSEILRVAQGQVRCGRCQTQFDALERLIEEGPGGDVESGRFLKPPRPGPRPSEPANIEVDEPDEQEDITLEGRHIEITGTYRVMDGAAASGNRQVRQEVTEEWAEIDETAADDDIDADADAVADAAVDTDADDNATAEEDENDALVAQALAEDAQYERQQAAAAAAALPRDPLFVRSRRSGNSNRATPSADLVEELDILSAKPQAAPDPMKWKILAAPLVLLLIAQMIHHYRSDLARHPQIGGPLMSLYAGLHVPLTPEWNLHAYEIKQWGVLSDPALPGTLKVRASITNRAAFAQPYPLLKLVLEDRWGEQVRAREFEPAEYLDPGTAANRLLSPQQQTNATVNIVDPGPDAEGFRFDVCLRGRSEPVCAAEVPE